MVSTQLTLAQWKALINQSSALFSLEVISESMLPVLCVGDEVLITPIDRLPKKGEVTVFYREHLQPQLMVHRCLGGLKFSGDNTMAYDRGVKSEHILGVVYQFRRSGELKSLVQVIPRFRRSILFLAFLKNRFKGVVKRIFFKK